MDTRLLIERDLPESRSSMSENDGGQTASFGLVMIGGALVGSAVHHLRIANELAERGFPVHVFWAVDKTCFMKLHPSIRHHRFFNIGRYNGPLCSSLRFKHSTFDELLGVAVEKLIPTRLRMFIYQRGFGKFDVVAWTMNALIKHVCRGVKRDRRQLRRFASTIRRHQITHLIPNIAIFGPFCKEVQRYVPWDLPYLLTFQGYEVYANYARDIGLADRLFRTLGRAAEECDFPAVSLSEDYKNRIVDEIGLSPNSLEVVPACISLKSVCDRDESLERVKIAIPDFRKEIPLITYFGRQDSEKGIDLLLYAAKLLEQRGHDFQLAVCGTTAWGRGYRDACRKIAENLRLNVLSTDYLTDETVAAVYRASHCVVYPSIHREPFGMVPVEAMAQRTPVVVPDIGGVASLPKWESLEGGLTFRAWDSGDLASQLERLLVDRQLYSRLQSNARRVAERYSVSDTCDSLLNLMSLPLSPQDNPVMDTPDLLRLDSPHPHSPHVISTPLRKAG